MGGLVRLCLGKVRVAHGPGSTRGIYKISLVTYDVRDARTGARRSGAAVILVADARATSTCRINVASKVIKR